MACSKHLMRAVSVVALCTPALAAAQSTAAPVAAPQTGPEKRKADEAKADPTQISDIIVTATRNATTLQNTPVAVTAISGRSLSERGQTSLLDIQNSTPNLTVSSRTSFGGARGGFTIRGIGVDSVSSSSAVGLYIDDVYYPAAAGNLLGLFDIDRIEVLRGPQGTLFGRNTIAGAVQYITVQPSQQPGGFVTASYGSFDSYNVSGALNVPLTSTLAVRVSGRYDRRGGFVHDDYAGIARGRDITRQGRIVLRWQPTQRLTINLKGEALRLENNGRAFALLGFNNSLNPPGSPNGGASLALAALGFGLNPADLMAIRSDAPRYQIRGLDAPERSTLDFQSGQINVGWEIGGLKVKSISAYSFVREINLSDLDSTPVPVVSSNRGRTTDKLFTQELQLSGNLFNDFLSFTAGGFYFNDLNTLRNRYVTFGPSPLLISPDGGDVQTKNEAIAGYMQAGLHFTDTISLDAGFRYSRETVTSSFLNTLVPGVGQFTLLPSQFAPRQVSYNDFSPSIGINFQVEPNVLMYAKAARGFRAGGLTANGNLVNPPAPQPPITATPGYQSFRPESAWTYELGTRLSFLNGRVRINPTAFYTDWRDIQFNSFVFTGNPPTPQIVTRNAGDARIWGLELEWQAIVSGSFSLYGSFSYLNARYTRVDPTVDVRITDPLQHTPKMKLGLGGRYSVDFGENRLVFSADMAFTDKQRSAVSNSDYIIQPGYAVANARIQYDFKHPNITLAVYGTNLTDSYYYIGGVNGSTTFGSKTADLGRPREFGTSATIRF